MAFSSFAGKVALQDSTFSFSDGQMQSAGNKYSVAGTAASDGSIKVNLKRAGGKAYVISGTLDKPTVESVNVPAAEASLR